MTYRRLVALPFVWAGLFAIAIAFVAPDDRARAYVLEGALSKGLAALGCFTAAFAFERGEYMRRAWSLNAWCYLLLMTRDVVLQGFGVKVYLVTGGLVIGANAVSVLGTLLLARAWSIAGLELPGSRAARYAVIGVAAAFALALSGTDLYHDARALLGGDLSTLHSVASDVGDIFGLCLIAPVLLTAIAMRGGVLKWPWGLLTACLVFWLLYDGISTIEHFAPGHPATMRLLRETFRALACVSECAAGLAQRRAITEPIDEGDAAVA